MIITLRNSVDGSTITADEADTDRLNRLARMGYRVVGETVTLPKGAQVVPARPTAKKRSTKK